MAIKTFLKRCKKSIGYRVHNFRNRHYDPDAQFNASLSHLFSDRPSSNMTIIDVGAHRGESVSRFKKLFPDAHIHSFEPDEENFLFLKKNTTDFSHVTLNNAGAGQKNEKLTFYRNLKSNTSSLNPINPESEWAQKRSADRGIEPSEYTQKSYDVDIVNLDFYIKTNSLNNISLLKIDTQGHEDAVLDGCKDALKSGLIDVIETELIVGDSYTKKLTFSDIEKRLLPYGYKFYGIDSCGDLHHTPWLSFNLIYVHERLLKS